MRLDRRRHCLPLQVDQVDGRTSSGSAVHRAKGGKITKDQNIPDEALTRPRPWGVVTDIVGGAHRSLLNN
jgi:hypothetical protein